MRERERAQAARAAQRQALAAQGAQRTRALQSLDRLLGERQDAILQANREDLADADSSGLQGPLRDRLALGAGKLETLRAGVRSLAASGDPVGRVLRATRLDEGLELSQVTSPLGVVLVIFESRPDAVVQIGSLAVRAGCAVLLKGGREASHSNAALVAVLREALIEAGLPADLVQGVAGRGAATALLAEDALIDLVIPRGSGAMVQQIKDGTRIPVLGHAEGICHLYLDAAADPAMAARLAVDGVCDYPAACNATETLLVHEDFLPAFQVVRDALLAHHATLVEPSGEADWRCEYGAPTVNVRVVGSLQEAVAHIGTYGSGHTDSIVTEDEDAARVFLASVDSASVMHNASTRFADGFRYGLGAEVGIATGRLHARGPVGVDGLLTTRWLLRGRGQVASEYSAGERQFLWEPMPPR